MDTNFQIHSIGTVEEKENGMAIHLREKYIPGLMNIEGFSHLQVVWWGHLAGDPDSRKTLTLEKLFRKAPAVLGVFSTRAPMRPNPILISTIKVKNIDHEHGIIHTPFIDAEPGTPVLDIKPYYPMERVKNCTAPSWCSHWPQWAEEAMTYDWHREMGG